LKKTVPERRFITCRECAELYHFHVQHVYELIARGLLPSCRIGGAIRVDRVRLDQDLENQILERAGRQQKAGWGRG
jgi:excisionase family DNA binding protein